MFVPKPFVMKELAEQHQFMHEFGFGIMVSSDTTCVDKNKLQASHLPFVLESTEGEYGTLYSHCARANPHWKILEGNNVLVTFSGPHSYISPQWYKAGPAVPTWNYTAVHVLGQVKLLDKEQSLQSINALVTKYEPNLLKNRAILTEAYQQKLLAGIVGFKIKIDNLEGKLKLGQQRSVDDQKGVFAGLSESDQFDALELAGYMGKYNIGVGDTNKN